MVGLRVRLVAHSAFLPPADVDWETDAADGEALVEFA
ncbi:MAG: FAD-dependent thymidylate synthase, partial [Williamsia herbipolensis]|nr:FAD-dependent thymidylate synthase [Williamsia herbipolensis]